MAIKTYKKGVANKLSANFTSSEFDCKGSGCCTATKVDEALVNYLQKIRDHFGKPVKINSGYRCATHNKKVGGATSSRHATGQAADIKIVGVAPAEIAKYAENIGVLGIGLYETDADGHFVHIDTRTTKFFWYGQAQKYRSTFGGNVIDISKVNTNAADPKKVWDYFKSHGLNDYGVAGLMGNLYAKSGLRACNLQNTFEKSLGYSDAEYTAAVDQEIYTNFINDKAGYGLAQWAYWSLKEEMYNYIKKKNKSIGDLDAQMEFLAYQLSNSFKEVWSTLQTATSVLEASNAVLLRFERPADQSVAVQNKRAGYGQEYYDKYAIKAPKDEFVVGDEVQLLSRAKYTSEQSVPTWVIKSKLYVRGIQDNGDIIISTQKTGAITGTVNCKYLTKYEKETPASPPFIPYLVQIATDVLNVRSGAGTNYKIVAEVKKSQIFAIVDEKNGWGKLESGIGWISLKYTKKI